MKSFFELLKDWKFSASLAAALALALYNMLYESLLMGIVFVLLIAVFVGLNLYFTKIRR